MNVLVTGASGGIGEACVSAFRARGAEVIGVDVEESSSADEHHCVDLSDVDCGERVARLLAGRTVDVLVNNAAYVHYVGALETDLTTWERTMAVNLRAPFLLAKAIHSQLEASRGSIVNVSSVHAVATSGGVAAYAASKGGLVSLTRALALEWAPAVRVNCVLPGAIETSMLSDGLLRSGITAKQLKGRHPMQRLGAPEEIAEAVLFLAQSEFTTGASLVVDGGATVHLSTE